MHPDRVVVGAEPGDEEAGATRSPRSTRRWAASWCSTDVASAEMIKLGLQRLPGRRRSPSSTRSPTSARRSAPTSREVARGMGLDERIGPTFLRAGLGYGGSCFRKDVSRAEAARRQHRLPLPAAQRGDRGQRAAEAARGQEAGQPPRARWSASGSRCSGLAFKPDTDDMRRRVQPRARGAPAGRGADVGAYDPVAMERAAGELPDGRDARLGARRRSRAPTPPCWSPSGPSSPSSTGRGAAKRMARPLLDRRPQLPRRRRPARRRASSTRGSAAQVEVVRAETVAD